MVLFIAVISLTLKYKKRLCKRTSQKQQAKSNSARKALHSIELALEKEPDNLLIVSDTQELIEKVLHEVDEKGVVPFSRWIQSHPLNSV
jgi:hypothetical protein